MGVILAIGNAIWEHEVGTRFQAYLPWDEAVDSAFFSGFLSFWSYIIILNTVVPISLYVRYALALSAVSQELGVPGKPFCGNETFGKELGAPSCASSISFSVLVCVRSRLRHCFRALWTVSEQKADRFIRRALLARQLRTVPPAETY